VVGKYNPDIHHRQSTRLKGYDYAQAGAYFVTICIHQRECRFGEVVDSNMRLNDLGRTVQTILIELPSHYQGVALDSFVVMPNHVHGIIVLNPVEARFIAPNDVVRCKGEDQGAHQGAMNLAPTVGEIVRGFKARCTHVINKNRQTPGAPVWQRNYYEHVIRNEADYTRIAEYVADNPRRWAEDSLHPDNFVARAIGVVVSDVVNDSNHTVGARFIAPDCRRDCGSENQGVMNQGVINHAPTDVRDE
jgi:putative transposase